MPASRHPRRLIATILAAATLVLAPVSGAVAQMGPPPVLDEVALSLSAEAWVTTETAEVTIGVDAVLTDGDIAGLRGEVLATLASLTEPEADWRITRFDRSLDSSGLERLRVTAQARLPDTALDGLADAVDAASRAGLRYAIQGIAFTPSLAEREAARANLRATLYADVAAELERLNTAFPDRAYRVGRIDFSGPGMPVPAPMMLRAEALTVAADSGRRATPVAVADRMQMTISVVFSAFADADSPPQ